MGDAYLATRLSRDELVRSIFALQPVVQRRFSEVLHRELGEELRDVTVHQLPILRRLKTGPVTMGELARSLHVSESAATAAADRLVRQGLAVRRGDQADRRVVRLSLSEAGNRLVRRLEQAMAKKTATMLGDLSDVQLEQLLDIFQTLAVGDEVPEEGGSR